MTPAGTIATMRVSGLPSGYPAEQEADVKVRFVDTSVEVLSDMEIPLLNAIGGPSQFQAPTQKIEWQQRDTWSDRGNLGAQLAGAGTTLTIDEASAHRYPRGSVLKIEDEYIWVSAQASTTTLTVGRGYAGSSDVTHASGVEFRLVGFTEVEGSDFQLRGSALHTQAYNFFSITKMASSESWIQSQQQTYVRSGPTMPEMMADNINQHWVGLEAALIEGTRYAGAGTTTPPMSGGLRYFVTSGNGAVVVDCAGQKLSRALIESALDQVWKNVGSMNMSRTVLCGLGAKRTLYREYIEPFVRRGPSDTTGPTTNFTSFETEFGSFNVIGPFKRIEEDELWIVNPALMECGTYGSIGRLHEGTLTTQGDYNKQFVFGMYGFKFKGIPGTVKLYNFTTD